MAVQSLLMRAFGLLALLVAVRSYRPADSTSFSGDGAGYTVEAERDRVISLPGANLAVQDFNLFAGWACLLEASSWHIMYQRYTSKTPCHSPKWFCRYITVDEKAGRALYYIFVESKKSAEDPLVLWLNGCATRLEGPP